MRPTFRATVLVLALTAAANARSVPEDRVNFDRYTLTRRTFDRFNGRPAEVGGRSGEMNSVTHTDWSIRYRYTSRVAYIPGQPASCGCPDKPDTPATPDRVRVTVTWFAIDGRQATTIFLPADATPRMRDHEQAHYQINAHTYDRAYAQASEMCARMMKRTFEADTLDQAKQQVDDAFHSEYLDPYAKWREDLHHDLNVLDDDGHAPAVAPLDALREVLDRKG